MKIIFIVDDDAAHRRVWERVLKRAGYGVVTASDGAKALHVLSQTSVDLMLLDVVMPDKDGFETLMALRASNSQIPVIAMSGSGGPQNNHTLLRQCRLLGATAILTKPFSEPVLIETITGALDQASAAR